MAQDLDLSIPEVWSRQTEMKYRKQTVMANLVSRQYQKDAQFGDTIHVQRANDLQMLDYNRNEPLTRQELNITDDTLLINQAKQCYFTVDKLDQRQSHHSNLLQIWSDEAAVAARNTVDAHLLGRYTDALAANIMGTSSTPQSVTASTIYGLFVDMGKNLDDNDVVEGERHAVISPAIKALIAKSPELTDRGTSMVDDVVRNGYVGNFGGFKCHVSTNFTAVDGAYPLMFFVPKFIEFVEQVNHTEMEEPHGYYAEALKMIKLYGSKTFNPEAGGVMWVDSTL